MGTRDNVTHNVIPPAGPARHVPSPVGRLPATLAAAREATYGKATSRAAAVGADARAASAHMHMHTSNERSRSRREAARVQV